VTSDIARAAFPLNDTAPVAGDRLEDATLARFAAALGDAQIVGLGEASHGTHEDLLLKTRLFQYLVLHRGFTVFAIEGDWFEWLPMEAYVNGGPGDPAAMLIGQDFSIYRVNELLPLLQWMRAYNALHPGSLHLVGIDAQEPQSTLNVVHAYAQNDAPAAVAALDAASACYLDAAERERVKISQAQADVCLTALKTAASRISGAHPSADAAASRALTAIGFLERATPIYVHHPSVLGLLNARDAAMAENVAYVARQEYPGAKMVVSAEDMHVATESATMPDWATMGGHLRETFGSRYYATDLVFHSGAIRVKTTMGIDAEPQRVAIIDTPGDEIGSEFSRVRHSFYLDLRAVDAGSALGRWLNESHTQWTFGGVVDPSDVFNSGAGHVVLAASFDGVFFVPVSTPTNGLQSKAACRFARPANDYVNRSKAAMTSPASTGRGTVADAPRRAAWSPAAVTIGTPRLPAKARSRAA